MATITMYESSTLAATTKSGKTKFWRCLIVWSDNWDEDNGILYTQQEYWQDNGKHQFSAPKEVKPKNVGRSNETAPMEQAHLEVAALISKKQDAGYAYPGEAPKEVVLPMLAHSYADHAKKVSWPCYAQYKLDGHRMLYSKDGGFWTRKGKQYIPGVVEHIRTAIERNFTLDDSIILDGEIMLPHQFTFQETTSAIKKVNENTPMLVYYVYDLYDPNNPELTFSDRLIMLEKSFQLVDGAAYVIMTWKMHSVDDVGIELDLALGKGYEGIMLRNRKGIYQTGYRSYDLQKVKVMEEMELPIVGYTQGEARDLGTIIFICQTPNGKQVNVRMRGSIERRKEMYEFGFDYIGKELTVAYQGLTDEGSLRFPVGIRIREDV